eukprot:4329478-Pyramimonas_sp.AAC.1
MRVGGRHREVFTRGDHNVVVAQSSTYAQTNLPGMLRKIGMARRAGEARAGVPRRVARREAEGASGTILTLHKSSGHWRVALVHHGARTAYHWDPYGHQVEVEVVTAIDEAYEGYVVRALPFRVQQDTFNCGVYTSWCADQFAGFISEGGDQEFERYLKGRMDNNAAGG